MKETTQLEVIIFLMAIILITMGGLLNSLVINTNGGRMPVVHYGMFNYINTSRHFSFTNSFEVNNYRLADIYITPINFQDSFLFFSLGDVFAVSGAALVVFWGMFVFKIKYLRWRVRKK